MQQVTEQTLLQHVKQTAQKGDINGVLDAIDKFCWEKQWMMNLGDVKGKLYTEEIIKKQSTFGLELGTYCGYSCLKALSAMPDGSKMVCVDPNNITNQIALEMFEYAGKSSQVELKQGVLSDFIKDFTEKKYQFDHILIDHDKKFYQSDFELIEKNNQLVKQGSVIMFDNTIIFDQTQLIKSVQDSQKYNVVHHQTFVEYSKKRVDGFLVATIL